MRQVLALFLVAFLSGCGASLKDMTDIAKDTTVQDRLSLCRAKAREAYYVTGLSASESLAVYDDCKKAEGL